MWNGSWFEWYVRIGDFDLSMFFVLLVFFFMKIVLLFFVGGWSECFCVDRNG